MSEEIKQAIIQIIGAIPPGRVTTYGDVAQRAGYPHHARFVGTLLRKLPKDSRLPWFRVVNSQGRISFPEGSSAWSRQKNLLMQDGITFKAGKIPLKQYRW